MPLSTSASSTSSSRGIRLEDMLASEACISAKAQSQGPWGALSHTLTSHTAVQRDPKQQQHVLFLLGFPWSVSLGPRHQTLGGLGGGGWGLHTQCRLLASSWSTGIILVRSTALQTLLPKLTRQARYAWIFGAFSEILIGSLFLSLHSSSSSFAPWSFGCIIAVLVKSSN